MQILQYDNYLALREGAKVIEKDAHGDKVLLLPDGTYMKLFRRKRLISSALFWPYAQRFADNAAKLKVLGIPCPEVINVYRIPQIQRDLVHYRPLPGLTLRQLRDGQGDCPDDIRERFIAFVHKLHDLGVYFRSFHLGNVILTPDNELGLIDFSDMQIKNRPLSSWLRRRNWQHTRRDAKDIEWLEQGKNTAPEHR